MSEVKKLFLPYMEEEMAKNMKEQVVINELFSALEMGLDTMSYNLFVPINPANKHLIFENGGYTKPEICIQPMIMTKFNGGKKWNAEVHVFNGYRRQVFYPYKLHLCEINNNRSCSLVMVRYILVPSFTSRLIRDNIRNYLKCSGPSEQNVIISAVCDSMVKLMNKPLFYQHQSLWRMLSHQFSKGASVISPDISKLCSYPSIITSTEAFIDYGGKRPEEVVGVFLRGLFFSNMDSNNATKTSQVMSCVFFFILYNAIEKNLTLECTFVIEGMSKKILTMFYTLMLPFTSTFENPRGNFVLRQNIEGMEDVNWGRIENYQHLKGSKNKDVKRILICLR